MKKIASLVLLTLALVSCKNETEKKENTSPEATVVSLNDFEQKAGDLVGKEIEIKGIVDHVCKHGGKRLLLVNDNGQVHVDSDQRFDDALTGNEIDVKGIVKEFRVDEAYCLQQEDNFIQKHKEGVDSDSVYTQKMDMINTYRDSMKAAGTDHLSFYSLEYVSHEPVKE